MSGEVYVRRASGLIRNISAFDAMIFNIMVMAPMAILVYGVWASVIYPGAHLPATALLAIPYKPSDWVVLRVVLNSHAYGRR